MTTVVQLTCENCRATLPDTTAAVKCGCGGLLSVTHAPGLRGGELRSSFDEGAGLDALRKNSGVWRFGPIVHPSAMAEAVSHPEGNTPVMRRDRLSDWTGISSFFVKHEGYNPTGSFKDRGMTVAMTQARRTGATAVACASTGNTSASLAAYAQQAGLTPLVFVPEGQVAMGKLAQSIAYGARTLVVRGDFDACLQLVQDAGAALGIYLVNSINPFRIEGQKSSVFELLRQWDWDPPDWIVLPAGNLGNTAAFGKALGEAREWGLISRMPRLVAVQAEGAAPFAAAFKRGFDRLEPVHADTLATAIRIGAPASYQRAVRAIQATDGIVLSQSDGQILEAKAMVDASGIGAEPASAASVAGARTLRAKGIIGADDRVVAILTGHLLKDPGIVERMHGTPPLVSSPNRPVTIDPTLEALRAVLEPPQQG